MVKTPEVRSLASDCQLHDPGLGRIELRSKVGEQVGQPRRQDYALQVTTCFVKLVGVVAGAVPAYNDAGWAKGVGWTAPKPAQPLNQGGYSQAAKK
jgi:hypothetical protein